MEGIFMDHPVRELMEEHRLIERVLSEVERRLPAEGEFPTAFLEQALDFFVNFADGCHHFKEEQALFPALSRAGVPVEGGPIGVMLADHRFGRSCIGAIRDSLPAARLGDADAIRTIRMHALDYVDVLRRHIGKEDHVLFQIAQHVLSQDEVAKIERNFRDPSNPRISPEIRRRYERMVEEMEAVSATEPQR
jgi:hemerythrin-like domain-containing protein